VKNILFLWLILSLTISACRQPLFGTSLKAPEIDSLLKSIPVVKNEHFSIRQLPTGYDANVILKQATDISLLIRSWLEIPLPLKPIDILVFSPTESSGDYYLKLSRTRHQSTGSYHRNQGVLLVTGGEKSARFYTILRHEAAHAALLDSLPRSTKIPFWLNEGVASFFEQAENGVLILNSSNERLILLNYLLADGGGLDFKELINTPDPAITHGELYARSWGLVYCLYHNDRPIKSYIQALSQSENTSILDFQKYLLELNESIASFEASCIQDLFRKNHQE